MQPSITLTRHEKVLIMSALLLGSFITTLAETLLNNGLPIIMEETHVSQMSAQWLNTGYMLVAGMVMPMTSFFMHRFKLRNLFETTMTIFLAGTLIATFAPHFSLLLLGRLIQAIAVGINMPLVTNVLTVIFPPERRGLALGIAGIIINLGPAMGPTLSGIILEYYNWRMLFIILIPLTLLTLILAHIGVKNVLTPKDVSLDFLSCVLVMLGLALLLYGLGRLGTLGANGWITALILLVGVISLTVFVRRQLQLKQPLLEMRVFKSGRYNLGLIITLLTSAAIMSPELMLPLFNQEVIKTGSLVSGMVMIPSALAMAFLSPLAGNLYDKIGIKLTAVIGGILATVVTIPMIFYNSHTNVGYLTVLYALRCAGLILCYTPATVYAINALPQKHVVSGNTIIVTMVQVANSFGTAIAVGIQNIVQHHQVLHGTSNIAAAVSGYQWSFGSTLVITVIALVLIFAIKNNRASN